jgi:acyl carrier protein
MKLTIEKIIRAWVKDNLDLEIHGDLFSDGKLDSLMFAELIAFLDTELKHEINFSDLSSWETINNLDGLSSFIANQISGT